VAFAKRYYAKRAEKYGASADIGSKAVWWLMRMAMEGDDLPLMEEIMAAVDVFSDPWNPNWYARYANFLFEKGRQQAGLIMRKRTAAIYPISTAACCRVGGSL